MTKLSTNLNFNRPNFQPTKLSTDQTFNRPNFQPFFLTHFFKQLPVYFLLSGVHSTVLVFNQIPLMFTRNTWKGVSSVTCCLLCLFASHFLTKRRVVGRFLAKRHTIAQFRLQNVMWLAIKAYSAYCVCQRLLSTLRVTSVWFQLPALNQYSTTTWRHQVINSTTVCQLLRCYWLWMTSSTYFAEMNTFS